MKSLIFRKTICLMSSVYSMGVCLFYIQALWCHINYTAPLITTIMQQNQPLHSVLSFCFCHLYLPNYTLPQKQTRSCELHPLSFCSFVIILSSTQYAITVKLINLITRKRGPDYYPGFDFTKQ